MEAKEDLLKQRNETVTERRGDDKVNYYLRDIISLLPKRDENAFENPQKLCDGYDKMSSTSDDDFLAHHLVSFVEEMIFLRNENS